MALRLRGKLDGQYIVRGGYCHSDAFSWGERLMLRMMGLPTIEEVEERTRGYRGFIASLTPEQIAAMDAYDGPEVLGPANGPKRKF
jgi:hypothetical protein